MPGRLYLIPTTISEEEKALGTIPSSVVEAVNSLRIFCVEEERAARRFLKKIIPEVPMADCTFFPLNEHTSDGEIKKYLGMLSEKDVGILSAAGVPCVADPGADFVLLAHQKNIEVIPLVGPSSILLALMASGLSGQNFAFHGYLPHERSARIKKIKELAQRSLLEGQTQIFMETPYRNQKLFEEILAHTDPRTLLCLAVDLTGPAQSVKTLPVGEWRAESMELNKKQVLFLLQRK